MQLIIFAFKTWFSYFCRSTVAQVSIHSSTVAQVSIHSSTVAQVSIHSSTVDLARPTARDSPFKGVTVLQADQRSNCPPELYLYACASYSTDVRMGGVLARIQRAFPWRTRVCIQAPSDWLCCSITGRKIVLTRRYCSRHFHFFDVSPLRRWPVMLREKLVTGRTARC